MVRIAVLLALLLAAAAGATAPAAGTLRIAVLGDVNGPYGATSYPPPLAGVIAAIATDWRPDLLLSPGDVVAGQNAALPDDRFAQMWAAFDAAVAAPLRAAGIPYAVAIGNHDGSNLRAADGSHLFERERAAARAYWRQPMHDANLAWLSREAAPFRASFRFGSVFVALWDASSARIDEAQWRWLERELTRPEARAADWRLLVGHLPLYGVGAARNRPGEVIAGGDAARRRLERLGVDVYISGHHAAYYPGRAGELLLLHAGGIGGRALVGDARPPVSTVTLLELGAAGTAPRLTAFDATTLRPLDPAALPARIDGLGGSVLRFDAEPVPAGAAR